MWTNRIEQYFDETFPSPSHVSGSAAQSSAFAVVPQLPQFVSRPDLYEVARALAIRDHEIDKLFNLPDYMI